MASDAAGRGRRKLRIGVAVLGALVLVGVVLAVAVRLNPKSAAAPTGTPNASRAAKATPSPTSTSFDGTPLAPGDHDLAVSVDGRDRTLILHVPNTDPGGTPRPLALVYHGALDTAANTQSETDFDQVADSRGMLVAFLQGYQDTWNEGAGHTPAEVAGVDDVAFTAAALAAIERSVPVDRTRVAAVGFSNGALLADLLGCRLAASLSVIVPVAGPLPVSVAATCKPARPISVLEIHGTADASIPYNGGAFAGVGGGTTVLSAPDAVARWASLDRCKSTPSTQSESSVRVSTYSGCANRVSVSLRTLVGAGHGWPSDIGESVAGALGLSG
jgi:polyhydroxybutyrate depolymerase